MVAILLLEALPVSSTTNPELISSPSNYHHFPPSSSSYSQLPRTIVSWQTGPPIAELQSFCWGFGRAGDPDWK
ncbi:hypothetical protein V6N13_126691 [Hibiscus sabdariffa]